MSAIVLVKYLFNEAWAPLEEVLQIDSKEYSAVHSFTDASELTKFMSGGAPTVILASVKSKEDITTVLAFLKANRKLVKDGNIKFAAVNFTLNRQVEAALMKGGCQEALDPSVRGKALKFKLDFWKKALSSNIPKGMDFKMKESGSAAAKSEAKTEGALQWLDALKLVDDVWISKGDPKKILGKWLVKIMGPSPMVAQWAEVPGKAGIWKFTFKEEARGTFLAADGDWYFQGEQKPDFIWKENQWMITGKQFQLFYQYEATKEVRLGVTQLNLEVCKNSTYALSREKVIIDSFDQELLVKKGLVKAESTELENELTRLDPLKGKTDGEAPLGGPALTGKGSTDTIGGAPLSGKSSTDRPGEGLLAGDVAGGNPSEGLLSGKGLSDPGVQDKPLSAAAAPLETGALLDAPTGTNPTGPLHGKMETEDVGPGKYKGRLEHHQSDRQAELGGKQAGTDDLGKSHYDGHTSHGKPTEKETGAPASHRDRLSEGLSGAQPGTDDLGKSHYGGATKPTEKTKAEAAGREAQAADLGGGLGGKQAGTDDLGKSHYGGKAAAQSGKGDASPDASSLAQVSVEARAAQASVVPIFRDRVEAEVDGSIAAMTEDAAISALMRKKGDKSLAVIVKIEDYFDDTLIYKVPATAFGASDEVEIVMTFAYMKINKRLEFSGKAIEAEPCDESTLYLTIQLDPKQVKLFEQFIQLYQMRQKQISQFIKQAKGL